MFVPKSIVCLREGYTRESLTRDVIAGVVVGIVALPLALERAHEIYSSEKSPA